MFKLKLFLLILLSFSWEVHAERIRVGATEWVGYTNADGTGIYNDIIKHVFADDELEVIYDSYQRKLHYFENGSYDLIIGVFLEDLDSGYIPYWHLDYEYPLLAFYNKKNQHISSAKDLNGAMLSWVRGYQIAQYIDVPHQSYLVSNERKGFELLLNNRIDVFIDYEYNLFDQYRDKVNFFEVLPSRKLYVAFANTAKGKRLAEKFDKKMLSLRNNGVLAKIYQEEYGRTLFDSLDLTFPKIEIRTRDVNLLRGNTRLLENSLEGSVFSSVIQSMESYNFDLVKYKSFTDDVKDFGQSNNTCIANKAKNEKRQEHFNFSDPVVMYPGLRIYSKAPLPIKNGKQSTNLSNLFSENVRLTIGVPQGQFFSTVLNEQIEQLAAHQKVATPADILTQLEALNRRRFDMKIEFPSVIENRWQYISDTPLFSYPLAGASSFTLGYLMCSKSETNDKFLASFNRALANLKRKNIFYQYHRRAAKSLTDSEFNVLFEQAYGDPRK
ncbi:transporter substrate-binding domain-containing protein [Thalassotalea sp. M1531]|uniref:Transporter substrate-binding domain-containing protein n=1 Tax=Thalassotalea algicola TaxID=2716224 RepID=A0A7Y0LAK1_9GAMM|nr:transporter substrate-binding domain-containing protein [Thalassotalea algicola]NMP30136.1 transporter substrate-binding domain-containing protein [Thalassotalea algicola]